MPGAWGTGGSDVPAPEPVSVNDRSSSHLVPETSPLLTPRGPAGSNTYEPAPVDPGTYQGYTPAGRSMTPTASPSNTERGQSRVDPYEREANWPICKPIIYHDIMKDVQSSHGRKLCARFYAMWYFACIAYIVNFAACLSSVFVGYELGIQSMGIALGIAVLGIPESFIFWYRMLYNSLRTDSSTTFWLFFVFFIIHVGMSVFLAVGVPGYGGSGVLFTIDILQRNSGAGITCAISTGLLLLETVMGTVLINQSVTYWKIRNLRMVTERKEGEKAKGVAMERKGSAW